MTSTLGSAPLPSKLETPTGQSMSVVTGPLGMFVFLCVGGELGVGVYWSSKVDASLPTLPPYIVITESGEPGAGEPICWFAGLACVMLASWLDAAIMLMSLSCCASGGLGVCNS